MVLQSFPASWGWRFSMPTLLPPSPGLLYLLHLQENDNSKALPQWALIGHSKPIMEGGKNDFPHFTNKKTGSKR